MPGQWTLSPFRLCYLWDFGAVPLLEPPLGLLVGVVLFAGVVVGEVGISRWTFRRCRWSRSCRCSSCSCCSSCCCSCSCCSRCCCGCGGSCSCGFLLWEMDCNLNVAQSLLPFVSGCGKLEEKKKREKKGTLLVTYIYLRTDFSVKQRAAWHFSL